VTECVVLRLVEAERFRAGYLTGLPDPGHSLEEAVRKVFGKLADAVAAHGIEPVQEKIYGLAGVRDEVLSIRKDAFVSAGLDPNLPCTFHQGRPIGGGDFAGVQLWGIAPADGETAVATARGCRIWTGRDYRVLHVPAISGLRADGRPEDGGPEDGVTEQAGRMLRGAESALEAHGFSFQSVARTWICSTACGPPSSTRGASAPTPGGPSRPARGSRGRRPARSARWTCWPSTARAPR